MMKNSVPMRPSSTSTFPAGRQLVERAPDLPELGCRAVGEQPDGLEVQCLRSSGTWRRGYLAGAGLPPGRCPSRRAADWYALAPSGDPHRRSVAEPSGGPVPMIAPESNHSETPPRPTATGGHAGTTATTTGHHPPGRHRRRGHPAGRPGGRRRLPGGSGRHRARPADRRRPEEQPDQQLRTHGVPVTVTVTGCMGLMGGTGPVAGYSCTGHLHPRRHAVPPVIPGTAFHAPGSDLPGGGRPERPEAARPRLTTGAASRPRGRSSSSRACFLVVVRGARRSVLRRRPPSRHRVPTGPRAVEPR